MDKLSEEVIDKMTKQEGCQSILHKYVKLCIEEFGCEPTRDAIEWFSCILSRELAEEYAQKVFHKKAEEKKDDTNDASVDKIHAA
jgi:hypothetical protein